MNNWAGCNSGASRLNSQQGAIEAVQEQAAVSPAQHRTAICFPGKTKATGPTTARPAAVSAPTRDLARMLLPTPAVPAPPRSEGEGLGKRLKRPVRCEWLQVGSVRLGRMTCWCGSGAASQPSVVLDQGSQTEPWADRKGRWL